MNFNEITEDFLAEILPHGSGIDADWYINQQKNGSWVCTNSFHAMNENGYYDGWIPFKVNFFIHQKDEMNELSGPCAGQTQVVHRKGDADFKVFCRNRELRDYLTETIDAVFSNHKLFECRCEII